MSKLAAHVEVEEITIQLSWGNIAGKWWGPKDVRPIVSLHGWQDNAGSFDRLIPLLPTRFSYLAIDLPGHGQSSRLAHGHVYATIHYVYILNILLDHFQWEKISLMGHSLGGIASFLFGTIFGHKIDVLICLDSFKPFSWHSGIQIGMLEQSMTGNLIADKRNQEQSEPPSYPYDEIVDMYTRGGFMVVDRDSSPHLIDRPVRPSSHPYDEMVDMYTRGGYMSVDRDCSSHLIDRAIRPSASDPNRFCFTRDTRLKFIQPAIFAQEICLAMAKRISIPFCFIKTDGIVSEQENVDEAVAVLRGNPLFEFHLVSGNYFVHINNPEYVSGIISDFIVKHHQPQKISKL